MSARRLRYRTAAECSAVVDRLRDTLEGWQRAWALEAAPLAHRLVAVETAPDEARAPWRTLGADSDGATAAFYRVLPAERTTGLGSTEPHGCAQRWLGLPSPGVQPREADEPPLGVRLAGLAHDALMRAVADVAGCAALQELPAGDAPRACFRPFSGALCVRSSGSGAALEWLLPASTVDRLLPVRTLVAPRERSSLVPVADALSQRTFSAGVEIDPVTLSLGELAGLRAGDVIALGHRLDAPLSVVDEAGDPLFGGFLVASDGRKSLKLHAGSNR